MAEPVSQFTKLDDAELFAPMFSNVCSRCARYWDASAFSGKHKCEAFPNGIPAAIWMGQNKHTEPYPGDNGLIFELHPEASGGESKP